MDTLLKELNQNQILWFAKLIVAFINIDKNISIQENEILHSVFKYIEDKKYREILVKQLEADEIPSLELAEGLGDSHLATTFIEMIKVVIADTQCVPEEISFLKTTACKFGFHEQYQEKLISWCNKGASWKKARNNFLPVKLHKEYLQVPLPQMSEELKIWFIEAAIRGILAEGVVDIYEIDFLKMVVSSIKNGFQRRRLVTLFRHKEPPFLKTPPRTTNEILILLYMEILNMIGINDNITDEEVGFLKNFCQLCRFQTDFFNKSLVASRWYPMEQ